MSTYKHSSPALFERFRFLRRQKKKKKKTGKRLDKRRRISASGIVPFFFPCSSFLFTLICALSDSVFNHIYFLLFPRDSSSNPSLLLALSSPLYFLSVNIVRPNPPRTSLHHSDISDWQARQNTQLRHSHRGKSGSQDGVHSPASIA